MESQPNTAQDDKWSFGVVQVITLCAFLGLVLSLIAMYAWTIYTDYPPKGFITG